eukprot:jgi/Mesvir1/8767/Mv02684-RA.2
MEAAEGPGGGEAPRQAGAGENATDKEQLYNRGIVTTLLKANLKMLWWTKSRRDPVWAFMVPSVSAGSESAAAASAVEAAAPVPASPSVKSESKRGESIDCFICHAATKKEMHPSFPVDAASSEGHFESPAKIRDTATWMSSSYADMLATGPGRGFKPFTHVYRSANGKASLDHHVNRHHNVMLKDLLQALQDENVTTRGGAAQVGRKGEADAERRGKDDQGAPATSARDSDAGPSADAKGKPRAGTRRRRKATAADAPPSSEPSKRLRAGGADADDDDEVPSPPPEDEPGRLVASGRSAGANAADAHSSRHGPRGVKHEAAAGVVEGVAPSSVAKAPPPRVRGVGHVGDRGTGPRGGGVGGDKLWEEGATAEEVDQSSIQLEAVVKVFCTHTEPNYSLPWQMKRQFGSSSSGFIIPGRRVLTNAHSVEHHTQVKLKRRGTDTKYVARVLAIGTECDIALLTVDDDNFWEGVQPVQFGVLPKLQDSVMVVGYPIGGDTMSVTSGVVSRIEVTSYVHGATELLGLQIDAAINSGNSGGPAFNTAGECVGIAFQSLKHEDAENIGYVVPTPVVRHFIQDYEKNGVYTGFPCLGVEWQKMENPHLRSSLGMPPDRKGVLLRRIQPTAPAAEKLSCSDILLSFDGVPIANDGTVPFRDGERISFSYLVSQKYTEEETELGILKNGKEEKVTVRLSKPKRLVPVHINGRAPSYFIVAGLVFCPVCVPYIRSEYGKEYDYEAPVKILDRMMHHMAKTQDEEMVVLSQVLAADVNIGYEEIVNTQVFEFNRVPIKNLRHLAELVEACREEYLRFDLEYNQVVVLDAKAALAASPGILETHCIPSGKSRDLCGPADASSKGSPAPAANGPARRFA